MRCLQIDEWGSEPTVMETDRPTVGPTDVLVEVEACGVGQTVQNVIDGNMKNDPGLLPRIPGHELVGRVVETGAGVEHLSGGDRVSAFFHLVCDHCRQCEAGRPTLCENHGGWVSVDIDGGFAEYASLPAGNAIPIDEGIDAVAATTIPDAIATPVHVARQRARIDPDDRVAVLGGGGGVGIHMVQVADHFGADVTAVDIASEKLARCREVGAAQTVDPTTESLEEAVDGPFDAVIDFTGDTALLEAGAEILGPRGRFVNLTTFPGNTMELAPRTEVLNEIEVVGSKYCAKHELRRASDLVASGAVEPVVSEVVELAAVPELLSRIDDNEIIGRGATTI